MWVSEWVGEWVSEWVCEWECGVGGEAAGGEAAEGGYRAKNKNPTRQCGELLDKPKRYRDEGGQAVKWLGVLETWSELTVVVGFGEVGPPRRISLSWLEIGPILWKLVGFLQVGQISWKLVEFLESCGRISWNLARSWSEVVRISGSWSEVGRTNVAKGMFFFQVVV